MGVFIVNRDFTIIANPEAVKLVPELQSLTEDEFWYVAMVADYAEGPLRLKPVDERKLIAKRKVFGEKKKNLESDKIKLAIDGYKSLVFDIRRETAEVYKHKVSILQKEMLKDLEVKRMKELDSSIQFLEDRIIKIEHSLNVSEEEVFEIRGNKKLSTLEQWQRNQKAYKEYKDS